MEFKEALMLFEWETKYGYTTPEEVKKEYRRLSKLYHPDKTQDQEIFKTISEAYTVLKDGFYLEESSYMFQTILKIFKKGV